MPTTAPQSSAKAAFDADAKYRQAKLISNIGFVVGGLFLFFSLWYILGKDTPLDLGRIAGALFSSGEGSGGPKFDISLELEPLDPDKIPPIFLDEPPPHPAPVGGVPEQPLETPEQERERRLKKALDEANQLFRRWRFFEAETSYKAVIKALSKERALVLKQTLTDMFFKRGKCFYRDRRYKKALEVLRIALHFDPKNREAHRYLARCYRLLGQGGKAKYHEKMVKKLG